MTDRSVLIKAANFCVYQDRTQEEVRQRLADWDVRGDDAEEIIAYLITENYLNEERFAKIYAGSKFRVKKWGRLKIRQALKQKRLSDYCVKAGMAEIDPDEYWETLLELIRKKRHDLRTETNPLVQKQKLVRFAAAKGYEQDLIWEAIKVTEGQNAR